MDNSMHSILKTAKRGLSLALGILATASLAHAAGFAIYENDARSLAMGNATVGRVDDASAIYSNPAAITQLPGLQIVAGASLLQPSIDVTTTDLYSGNSTTYSMNSYTEIIPHLYATYRLTDNLSVGLGVFVPYGLKSDFAQDPHSWAGAYNNYYTKIESYEITPTIAYRLVHDQPWAKQISVAAGFAILHTDIDLRRQIALPTALAPTGYTPLIMQGQGWDYSYNLSLQYEINDQVSLGIVYRSGFACKYNAASAQVVGVEKGNAKSQIDLPDSWIFGVNYSPITPLNIGASATLTRWSSYDSLNISFYNMNGSMGDVLNFNGKTSSHEKAWKDVWRYSIGAEYQVNNALALRAGFVIDKDPVNSTFADFMVPSNDRQIYSLGLGWTISKNVVLDFAYAYVKIKSSVIAARPTDGIITDAFVNTGHANVFSVSANFRF